VWHIVLFHSLKGSLGPATVPLKSLNSNQCTGGCVIAFVLVIRTLIIESGMVADQWWPSGGVLSCSESGVVESDPPNGCLTFPQPDRVDGLSLLLIVGYVIATTDGIAEDAFLDCMARVRADLPGATVEDDVAFVMGIDRPETEP